MIATLGRFAREQIVELVAGVTAAAFLLTGRVTLDAAARSIDTGLLLLLFALLLTVEVLRRSGYVDAAVAGVVSRVDHARLFAAVMIVASGLLAAMLTNDAALFVVIPFTVIASRMSSFDVENAVVLQIVAANLLGCLTPLGNPQNLFVYHRSGWGLGEFVGTMAPFVAWNALGIGVAIAFVVRGRRVSVAPVTLPPKRLPAALAGAVCFLLVVLDVLHLAPAWLAAAAATITALAVLGRRIAGVDLSIIPLFFFAFIVVEGLQTFDLVALMRGGLYMAGLLLSQVISNVPATILLTPVANGEWRELLYAVNAGGCGTIVASLANLLGWRIYVRESNRDPRFFWRLTTINFAFLAWAGLGGWILK